MIKKTILLMSLALVLVSCSIRFTMRGSSVPSNISTFSVQYFDNRAPLINPLLSQQLTEALKDRVITESRLILVEKDADVDFSGEITGYSVRPMAIQADALSAETRLQITIKVRYRNFKDPETNWEQSFSAYEDYASDQNLTSVESELVDLILEQITQDVFNTAFSDW